MADFVSALFVFNLLVSVFSGGIGVALGLIGVISSRLLLLFFGVSVLSGLNAHALEAFLAVMTK